MHFGSQRSKGQLLPITADPQPTLILRSPETFHRLFLDTIQDRDAAFFGDVSKILPYIPKHRITDTKLIHLSPDRPIGINPFFSTDYAQVLRVADAFEAVWGYRNTPTVQLGRFLLFGSLAMATLPNGSLFHLHYLFTSPEHRARAIPKIPDSVLRQEWERFHALPSKDQDALTSSITNRLSHLVLDPTLRTMVSQLSTIDTSGIVLVDLPDAERYDFLAVLLLSHIKTEAYIERPLIHLGESIPIVSALYLDAIPEPLRERLLNTAVILTARTGAVDAKILEPHFNLDPGDHRLTALPKDQGFVRLERTHLVYLEPHSYPARSANERKIRANTVQRFGTPRTSVEGQIDRFTASTKNRNADTLSRRGRTRPRTQGGD